MKKLFVSLLLINLLLLTYSIAKEDSTLRLPSTYEKWVLERVGPVVYPAPENDPYRTWDKFLELTGETKFKAVKTWLGTYSPGESVIKLQKPHYVQMCDTYSVVQLNICSGYLNNGYSNSVINDETKAGIERDWYECAEYLYQKYKNSDKTFLLSVCAELNVYMGTEGHNPDLPVAEYVNLCQKGLEDARNKYGNQSKVKIYSVAEIQCEIEYEKFIKKFVPQMTTDLYSLSFYCFYKDFEETLSFLGKYAPASEIFGEDNLIVGEFGPPIELCNMNETARIRYYDTLLRSSYKMNVQYAFFYSLADTEHVINAAGHDGLYGWKDEKPFKRKLWNYFYEINAGGKAEVPTIDYREPVSWQQSTTSTSRSNLIVTEIKITPEKPKPGDSVIFTATIKNSSPIEVTGPCVNFFVDDYIVSWACIGGSLKPNQSQTLSSENNNKEFVWKAKPGKHNVTALVDPKNLINESSRKDNYLTLKFDVK